MTDNGKELLDFGRIGETLQGLQNSVLIWMLGLPPLIGRAAHWVLFSLPPQTDNSHSSDKSQSFLGS